MRWISSHKVGIGQLGGQDALDRKRTRGKRERLQQCDTRARAEEQDERTAWTPEEIQPTIAAYFDMVAKELAQEKVVKAHVYCTLEEEGQRTSKSYEFKMQNSSAVLALNDLPFLRGLLPAKNFQRALEPQVLAYLDKHPEKRAQLLAYDARCNVQTLFSELVDSDSLVEEPRHTMKPRNHASVPSA